MHDGADVIVNTNHFMTGSGNSNSSSGGGDCDCGCGRSCSYSNISLVITQAISILL